jgi:hypothetical protein
VLFFLKFTQISFGLLVIWSFECSARHPNMRLLKELIKMGDDEPEGVLPEDSVEEVRCVDMFTCTYCICCTGIAARFYCGCLGF